MSGIAAQFPPEAATGLTDSCLFGAPTSPRRGQSEVSEEKGPGGTGTRTGVDGARGKEQEE